MKLKEYITNLNALVKENPEVLEMEAISSSDDEGNSFGPVVYGPTKGLFEDGSFDDSGAEPNAVCIN